MGGLEGMQGGRGEEVGEETERGSEHERAQVVVQRIGVLVEPSYDFVAHVARKVRDGEVRRARPM